MSEFVREYAWMKRTNPQSTAEIREVCNVLAECDRMWNPHHAETYGWKDSKRKLRLVRMFDAFRKMGV